MFNFPGSQKVDVQTFFRGSSSSGTDFQNVNSLVPWNKPPGVNFVYIMLVGAGGGGSVGFSGSAGTNRNGGGGGAGGNVLTCMAPAILIPDLLYVSIGAGGAGGTGTLGGSQGGSTRLTGPFTKTTSIFVVGGGTGSNDGGGNASSVGGGNGTTTNSNFGAFNLTTFTGMSGSAGGAANVGTDITLVASGSQFTGGTGGGGVSSLNAGFTGGGFTAMTGVYPAISGGGVASNGGNGPSFFVDQCFSYGGTGGGGNPSGTGGIGGNGGPGAGGGGGGAGLTGGNGGKGGDGFAIIASW